MKPAEIVLTRPDDWHLHLRDGDVLRDVVPDTARVFGRAVVMPNLVPAVCTVASALDYRHRILAVTDKDSGFEPLMALYLTDQTEAAEIRLAAESPYVIAAKLYPAGATTNSAAGVSSVSGLYPALDTMQACGLPLLVHGEVVDPDIDVFDREAVFIDRHLLPIVEEFPELKVVLEHVTTQDGVDFVCGARDGVAGTITAHHLLLNRNALFAGGLRPHHYCLPVLKRERHREALLQGATHENGRFFLGTDSAPHPVSAKHSACGCAGIYTAHAAMALYAEAFEAIDALDKLEAFASFNGPDFYGLARNVNTVRLCREPMPIPDSLPFGEETLMPFMAGKEVAWRVQP